MLYCQIGEGDDDLEYRARVQGTRGNWSPALSRANKLKVVLERAIDELAAHYGADHVLSVCFTSLPGQSVEDFEADFNSYMTNKGRGWMLAYVKVKEYHRNGRIHLHLVVAVAFSVGFHTYDWASHHAAKKAFAAGKTGLGFMHTRKYGAAVTPGLRALWERLDCQDGEQTGYGFGRIQATPIEKDANWLAGYLTKRLSHYLGEDLKYRSSKTKGRRHVEFSRRRKDPATGLLQPPWRKTYAGFAFWSPDPEDKGRKWRKRVGMIAEVVGAGDLPELSQRLGKRWAYHCKDSITMLDDAAFAVWLQSDLQQWVRYHQSALLWRPPPRNWHERTKRPGAGVA